MISSKSCWSNNLIALINSSRKLSDFRQNKTKELIEQSKSLYAPYQDPLSLDFISNRWFAAKREEHYSDWLAWILEQLDDPKLIFSLLKIEAPYTIDMCRGVKLEVLREFSVEKGHEDQSGRLDILIRYPQLALIVIEVKLTDADSSDYAKNAGYFDCVNKMFLEKEKHCKFLVVDAEQQQYDGFKVLKWSDICRELRHIVSDSSVSSSLLNALMLSFVGAVEQNLLGLKSFKSNRFNTETISYLHKALPGGNVMGGDGSIAEAQLIKDGISLYLDSLFAIGEFQEEMLQLIKKVLDRRLPELGTALMLSLSGMAINKDHDEGNFSGEYARLGWTIGGFDNDSTVNVIYFCFYLEREKNKVRRSMGISFGMSNTRQRDALLKQCQTISNEFGIWDKGSNEVGLADYSIDANNVDSLEIAFNGLIDRWIDVWKSIHGVQGLV